VLLVKNVNPELCWNICELFWKFLLFR